MRLRFGSSTLNERTFLVLQLFISVLIIFFTITDRQSLTSAMFALSFINLLVLYLTSYRSGSVTSSGWLLLNWCVFSIVISYMIGSKNFAWVDLVSFATFASTIVFLQVVCNIEVTKKLAHAVLFIGVASAALYPIGFYFLGANEFRDLGSSLLTMHFSNPNLTGMYLAQACLYSILCFFLTKKKLYKIIAIIICVIIYIIYYLI